MPKMTHLNSGKILDENLPFSEAVQVGDLLFLSGQIGVLPHTLTPAPGGIEAETRQMMENLRTILETHNSSLSNLVRCTVMLADMDEWQTFNTIYVEYFDKPYPARSAFAAKALALNARVEMECIALINS